MFGCLSAVPGMKSKIACRNTNNLVVLADLRVHLPTRNQRDQSGLKLMSKSSPEF
jgi:hypothetical protein